MYVVTYTDDYDLSQHTRVRILDYPAGLTWRQLQQRFDPNYHYSYLKFYLLGSEILLEK